MPALPETWQGGPAGWLRVHRPFLFRAVAPDEQPGRLHLVDVVQMDQRSRRPQGGLTFVVKVS